MTERGDVLVYHPSWSQRGDPDAPGYALLYGFVALATIWLLEHICELILFSTAKGILLSDAAAHIALNNSNWLDIARWLLRTRRDSRLCRRAFMALVFRCALICIDVGIMLAAIPHNMEVYESSVGGTELSFSHAAFRPKTVDLHNDSLLCKPELIRYEGFNPTTLRTICLLNLPLGLPDLDANSNVATFYFNFTGGMLQIRSTRSYNRYIIRHSMRLIGGQMGVGREIKDHPYLLISSLRKTLELAPQAARIASESALVQGWGCVPRRISRTTAVMNCTTAPSGDQTLHIRRLMVEGLFDCIGTVKIDSKETQYSVPGISQARDTGRRGPRLGTITRPRLCIFPALILLLSIGVVSLIVRFFTGSQDFAWKLWLFLSLSAGMSNMNTPFSTRCTEIDVVSGLMRRADFVRRNFDGEELDIEEGPRLHMDVPEEYDESFSKYPAR